MSLKRFEKLPALLVMEASDIDKAARCAEEGKFLLDDQVQIVSYPLSEEIKKEPLLMDLFSRYGNSLINKLFVLDPCNPNSYIELEQAYKKTPLEKADIFAEFCAALGAKQVNFSEEEKKKKDIMVRFNSLVKGKLGWLSNNKTNIDAKWSENILKNLKAGYVFSSNGIADFKLAKAIMVKHGLEKEVSFQKIFSMRKNENNLLMSRNISLNLTQELDSRIKIATDFSGKIPVGSLKIIGIKAEIDVIKKSCHQIVTKTEVVF